MKVEIDIPDETIRRLIKSSIEQQATLDYYGKPNGPFADQVKILALEQTESLVQQIDIPTMVQERIDLLLTPTLETIIDQQIKTAAKKAVKVAMDKHQETQP